MKLYQKILVAFDLPGGTVLGLFSLETLAILAYCAVTGKPFSPIHRDIYLGVIGCFAANKTAKVIKGESK
jgi:hypothetical protein